MEMMMTIQDIRQHHLVKLLLIIGSIIFISGYINWYILAYWIKVSEKILIRVNNISEWIGIILILKGISLLKIINKELKYLLIIPIMIFYIGIFLAYGINDLLELIDINLRANEKIDDLLKGHIVIPCLILSYIRCIILYLYSLFQK